MRVLLTGATGFIGRSLSAALSQTGYQVYGLLKDDKFAKDPPSKVAFVKGDLTEIVSLSKVLSSLRPDIVVHLAALTPVRHSFASPTKYAETNYIGTINLVKAVTEICTTLVQFVHASTAEAYRPKSGFIRESDPLFGSTPYGISKAASDFYVQMSGLAYNLPFTILRPTNTFGRPFELPDEARGYLVEKAMIQMLSSRECVFDGYPTSRRCWMHVDNHVGAYLHVIDNPKTMNNIFNVSPNNAMSVGKVVELIAELTRFHGTISWGANPRPYDPEELCLDGTKLKATGWRPSKSLREGLAEVVQYWQQKLATVSLTSRHS